MKVHYALYDFAVPVAGDYWNWFEESLLQSDLNDFYGSVRKHCPEDVSKLSADDFWGGIVRTEGEWTIAYRFLNGGLDRKGRKGRYILLTAWIRTEETENVDLFAVFDSPIFQEVAKTVESLPIPKPAVLSETVDGKNSGTFDKLLKEAGTRFYSDSEAEQAVHSFSNFLHPASIRYERSRIPGHEHRAELTIAGETNAQRLQRENKELSQRIDQLEDEKKTLEDANVKLKEEVKQLKSNNKKREAENSDSKQGSTTSSPRQTPPSRVHTQTADREESSEKAESADENSMVQKVEQIYKKWNPEGNMHEEDVKILSEIYQKYELATAEITMPTNHKPKLRTDHIEYLEKFRKALKAKLKNLDAESTDEKTTQPKGGKQKKGKKR